MATGEASTKDLRSATAKDIRQIKEWLKVAVAVMATPWHFWDTDPGREAFLPIKKPISYFVAPGLFMFVTQDASNFFKILLY
jgi:uncharacterized membrane protein YkvA (DUF1232 family)